MNEPVGRLGVRAPPLPAPDRWRAIEPIIDGVLARPLDARRAFVRSACAGDPTLLADVDRLLSFHEGSDAELDHPAAQRFASLLDDEAIVAPEMLGGHYRIDRILGRGGMATVFLADDLRHGRKVAVKVLHAELAAALGVERFLVEIRTTAQLHHSHILPLHDSGDADGLLYYVMPYVPGDTLRRRLREEHALPIDDAVRIASEVASALDAAHRCGVIHRDVKPENILLHDGTALVADFGIALAVSEATSATESGVALGTPQYMSSEQATGGALDSRSDVYSLGVVVYEMLVGYAPWDAPAARASLARRTAPPLPSARAARREIPEAIDAAVARAMSWSPADRFGSAGEFAAELRHGVTSDERPFAPGRSRRMLGRRVLAAGLGAAVLMLGILVAVFVARSRVSVPGHRSSDDQQAVALYQQGAAWLDQRTPRGGMEAKAYFEQAIARDPGYSEAYSGLADVYTFYGIGNVGDYRPQDYFPQAKAAARRALDLDSTSGKALTAGAQVRLFYDFDWDGTARELQRSMQSEPQYLFAHEVHIILLEFTGPFDKAVFEARDVLSRDPLSMQAATELGRTLFFNRQFAEAARQLSLTIERDSMQYRAHMALGEVLEALGKRDSAVLAMQAAVRHAPASSRPHAFLVYAYARAGRTSDALRELQQLKNKSKNSYVPAFDLAVANLGLNRMDETFAWLWKAFNERSIRPFLMDPTFDPIRSDPRYRQLIDTLRLGRRPISG